MHPIEVETDKEWRWLRLATHVLPQESGHESCRAFSLDDANKALAAVKNETANGSAVIVM